MVFEPPGPSVVIEQVHFEQVRFSVPALHEFVVRGARLVDCTFTGAIAETGNLGSFPNPLDPPERRFGRALYRGCRFENCDLSPLYPGWARFEECVFTGCRIEKWFAFDAEFVGCAFPKTSLRETTFAARSSRLDERGRDHENEVRGNDFRGADLLWTSFIGGVDLRAQTWPEDEVLILTDIQARLRWARSQIERWKDRDRRKRALVELEEITIREGPEQRDLFIPRAIIGHPETPDLYEELYCLLEQAPV